MKAPIWITLDGGELFEGHQGHWADCFFSNATESAIRQACIGDQAIWEVTIDIRPMTEEELTRYPEAIEFQKWLIDTYNEC